MKFSIKILVLMLMVPMLFFSLIYLHDSKAEQAAAVQAGKPDAAILTAGANKGTISEGKYANWTLHQTKTDEIKHDGILMSPDGSRQIQVTILTDKLKNYVSSVSRKSSDKDYKMHIFISGEEKPHNTKLSAHTTAQANYIGEIKSGDTIMWIYHV